MGVHPYPSSFFFGYGASNGDLAPQSFPKIVNNEIDCVQKSRLNVGDSVGSGNSSIHLAYAIPF